MTRTVRPMDWAEEIGARIAQARHDKGWTQSELADLLVVHRNTVDNYEAGKGIPNRDLQGIAGVLGVEFRWLLHGPALQDPLLDVQQKLEAVLALLLERELADEAGETSRQRVSGSEADDAGSG